MKNLLSLLRMNITYIWCGCSKESNILCVMWSESVMTTILEMSGILVAWLMPHLIGKSLALVVKTFIVWWIVLVTALSQIWIWAMEMAILFLILVSVTTRAWDKSSKNEIIKLFSKCNWVLKVLLLLFLKRWNKKQLENESIILKPKENSLLSGSNTRNTSLNLLSMLTTDLLIINCWHGVSKSKEN